MRPAELRREARQPPDPPAGEPFFDPCRRTYVGRDKAQLRRRVGRVTCATPRYGRLRADCHALFTAPQNRFTKHSRRSKPSETGPTHGAGILGGMSDGPLDGFVVGVTAD